MGIIKKQSIQSTLFTYLGVGIGFFNAGIFLPMLFSTEQVGLLGFLVSLTSLFSVVASLGIPLITTRLFPHFRSETHKDHSFFTITTFGSLAGILLGLIVFFLFEDALIRGENNAKSYPYFVLMFCFVFIARLVFLNFDTYLKMRYKTVLGNALENFVVKLLILFVLVAVFFWREISFDWVFLIYGISLALPGMVLIFYMFTQNVNINFSEFFAHLGIRRKEIVSIGFFGLIGSLSAVIVLEIDRIMISNMLGLSSTGIYSVAFFFGTVISVPSRALKRIAVVIISDSLERNDMENIQTVYSKSCITQLLIAGYLFLGIWFCVDYVFEYMKPEYATGIYVVFFIGLAQLIDMATGINAEIISLSKYYRANAYFYGALVVMIVALNFLCIPIWGISGAAFASFCALLIINAMKAQFLYKKMKLQPYNWKMAINVLLIGAIFMLMSILPQFKNPIIGILVSGTIITVIYWSAAYFLRISDDINHTIDKVIKRFVK